MTQGALLSLFLAGAAAAREFKDKVTVYEGPTPNRVRGRR